MQYVTLTHVSKLLDIDCFNSLINTFCCPDTGMVVFDQSVTGTDKAMTMLLNSNDVVCFMLRLP